MLREVVYVALSVSLFVSIGVAGAAFTVRAWRARPWIGVGLGLLATALCGLVVFYAFILGTIAGAAVTGLILGSSVWGLFRFPWRPYWRSLLQGAALFSCGVAIYLSLGTLWRFPGDLAVQLQNRFFALPIDNQLPTLFVQHVLQGNFGQLMVGDWHSSDRPPLQTGLILLVEILSHPSLIWAHSPSNLMAADVSTVGQIVGLVSQCFWIVGLYCLLSALDFRKKSITLALVGCFVTPVVLVNSLFVWPKMLAASLMLIAYALAIHLVKEPRSIRTLLPFAFIAATLSVLSHGGAAFALPGLLIPAWLIFRSLRKSPPGRWLIWFLAGVGASLVLYLPWTLYQKLLDPPGDRLLKWHFAGVIPVNESVSFFQALLAQYNHMDFATWATGRVANLDTILGWSAFGSWISHPTVESAKTLDFYSLLFSCLLGLVLIVLALLAARRGANTFDLVNSRLVLLGTAVSVLVWACVMFIPGSTLVHQGTLIWCVVVGGLGYAMATERFPRLVVFAIAIQTLYSVVVYSKPSGNASASLNLAAVALGACALLASLWLVKSTASEVKGSRIIYMNSQD